MRQLKERITHNFMLEPLMITVMGVVVGGIAMGLLKHGPTRMGEIVEFNTAAGGTVKARVRDTVFFDKDGEKQNV